MHATTLAVLKARLDKALSSRAMWELPVPRRGRWDKLTFKVHSDLSTLYDSTI